MNKPKNNQKGREDQALPESKTPPRGCEAKELAPNVDSILTEIGKINGFIEGTKTELSKLASRPDVDLSPINALVDAVNSGFGRVALEIKALTEAQANAASKDDIDQLKQMIAGLALGMGDVKAGVGSLHGKVDVIGQDATEIKAGVLSIEQKIDILTEGMSLIVGDLHAIRASLNALEQKTDVLAAAIADVKSDTQYIPQMADDLKEFRDAFDGAVSVIFETLIEHKGEIINKFVSKIESYNQNVNKLSASVSQASKYIIGLSDGCATVIEDINTVSIKARNAANMAEATLKKIAEEGAQAVGEQLFEEVKGWINPLISNITTACSEETFMMVASRIATSSEKIATGVNALNSYADGIPKEVEELKDILELMVSAKAISHQDFISRTNELDAAYAKISGHLQVAIKKADAATASVERFSNSGVQLTEQISRDTTKAAAATIEGRLNGIEERIGAAVFAQIENNLPNVVKDSLISHFNNVLDDSITP